MRWTALIALGFLFSGTTAPAQMGTDDTGVAPIYRPPSVGPSTETPTYDPSGPSEGPSDAEIGPVQKHFVMATNVDDLAETQNEDNATFLGHEKTALDKQIRVPLIHDVLNDGINHSAGNRALKYEVDYLNWGAVTGRQLLARRGHYFTITWANHGPANDFTARFEYRQVKSKEIVRVLSQQMPHVSGTTRSYFAVASKAFLTYGPVCSWRFTILKGDTVVAEAKSFIW